MAGFESGALGAISSASHITKAILLILLLFSVVSWAIILNKFAVLRRVARENRQFLTLYRKLDDLAELSKAAARLRQSAVAAVFLAGVGWLRPDAVAADGGERGGPEPKNGGLRTGGKPLERALRRGVEAQANRLESDLAFLATAGNVAPFIGLLGTVLGIIDAFHEIGRQQTASIAAVAPGVSEALVATAAGLFAAIPAVIAYNYFLNRVRVLHGETQGFADELANRLEERPARTWSPKEVGR